MFFFPCENSFDYTSAYCGYACFYSSTIIVAYESLVHEAVPIILIALFSVGLLIRVVLQKRRLRRTLNWRNYRKMTIQLVSVSTLYFATNFPYTINPILTLLFNVTPINENIQSILLNFVSVVMPLILPYVSLGLIPNLRQKFYWRNQRRGRQIQPFIIRGTIPNRETHF
jgi:cytochrome bd-type quinol oxidase subunit 2